MKIEFYPEICCDECNDVIHNHMDCPECKKEYAGTDVYIDLDARDEGETISCEECKAEFKLIKKQGYHDEWEWERV